jgi:nucleoside-diphosphate-sugar epimerase
MLDGRRAVILPARGETVFHTTAARNLAELVRLAATRPGRRVLNCGDPDPPDALRISRAIARALDHEWVEVTLPGPAAWGSVGDHPWLAPEPFILDTTRAELELGYRPVVTYADAVPETCKWLVEATRDRDWRDVFPAAAEHLAASFDYAAEDAFLAGLSGSSAAA